MNKPTASKPPTKGRRRRRTGASEAQYRTSRTVAKRTDLFADVDDYEGEHTTELGYASGRGSGPITWTITEANGAPLDSHALALFAALTELYLSGATKRIQMQSGEIRIVVDTTARHLVEMVYGQGHDSQDVYAALGLLKDQPTHQPGGLQRLFGVSIRKGSHWIHPKTGKRITTTEDFRLVDWIRQKAVGAVVHLQIALGSPVQEELINGGFVRLPVALVQALGPKRGTALRVATHLLGQEVLPAGQREIGLSGLAAIIRPDTNRDPARYPGRYRGYVQRIIDQIQAADSSHTWTIAPAKTDPLGKLVCQSIKNTSEDKHDVEPSR